MDRPDSGPDEPMRHQHGNKKIARPTDQRLALLKTQAKSLIDKGEFTTTHAKAKALARYVQKLVSFARKGDVASLRRIRQEIDDRTIIKKLTTEIVPKLPAKAGGEVNVYSAGQRRGDGAQIAVITFNIGRLGR
jgi:large subunit ribosomal protein L17